MLDWPDYIGELHVKDESHSESTKLVAGDVLHVDHGSHNIFSTPTNAKGKMKSFKLPIW